MYLQEKSQQVNINNLQGLENPHNLIPIDIRYYQIGSLRCFFKNFLKGIFKKKRLKISRIELDFALISPILNESADLSGN